MVLVHVQISFGVARPTMTTAAVKPETLTAAYVAIVSAQPGVEVHLPSLRPSPRRRRFA